MLTSHRWHKNVISKAIKDFAHFFTALNGEIGGKRMISDIFKTYLSFRFNDDLYRKTELGELIFNQLINKLQNLKHLDQQTCTAIITGTYEE